MESRGFAACELLTRSNRMVDALELFRRSGHQIRGI